MMMKILVNVVAWIVAPLAPQSGRHTHAEGRVPAPLMLALLCTADAQTREIPTGRHAEPDVFWGILWPGLVVIAVGYLLLLPDVIRMLQR